MISDLTNMFLWNSSFVALALPGRVLLGEVVCCPLRSKDRSVISPAQSCMPGLLTVSELLNVSKGRHTEVE